MIGATLKIIGINRVVKGLDAAKKKSSANSIQALKQACMIVEREAKKRCPVDVGRLRSSLTHEIVNPKLAKVGTNVHYGKYVEFGTKRKNYFAPVGIEWASRHGFGDKEYVKVSGNPKPFLTPALVEKRKEVQAALKKGMKF